MPFIYEDFLLGTRVARRLYHKYAEAEPYFRKVIDEDRLSYPGYMNLYRLYIAERKTAEAGQLLDEAARNMPERTQEWNRLRTSR